jgi:hypothetical protein
VALSEGRHTKKKVRAAAERSMAKHGMIGVARAGRRMKVEVFLRRGGTVGDYYANACIPGRLFTRAGAKSGRCGEGRGRTPTKAFKAALRALAKRKL